MKTERRKIIIRKSRNPRKLTPMFVNQVMDKDLSQAQMLSIFAALFVAAFIAMFAAMYVFLPIKH